MENTENLSERGEAVNRAANVMRVVNLRTNQMGVRLLAMVLAFLALAASPTAAATWSRAYIRQLPDSAFAAVERSPGGRQIRHLPHHDATGALDLPHLCNALARFPQVEWRDPANAEIARRHLREHLDQVRRGDCRPLPRPTS
jgi:hypothetical protein